MNDRQQCINNTKEPGPLPATEVSCSTGIAQFKRLLRNDLFRGKGALRPLSEMPHNSRNVQSLK